jgi:hypothetical protein
MLKTFKIFLTINIIAFNCLLTNAQSNNLDQPRKNATLTFEEKGGIVAVEAEDFYKQDLTNERRWYRTSISEIAEVSRDDDNNHASNASNSCYIEILPDTRVTHDDKLVVGENFSNKPGEIAVVSYKIKFNTAGRYYVWARAFSTGSEDNGLHVGLNDVWPEHGKRMQWCKGKNKWTWASKQRTKEEHCGISHAIYLDIEKPGTHTIQFSMREDGFEFDKFVLTKDINYTPIEKGPEVKVALKKSDTKPTTKKKKRKRTSYFNTIKSANANNKYIAAQDFPIESNNFYKNGKNWLAIHPEKHKQATTSTIFNFESGRYDIVFVGVGENDGNSNFKMFINKKKIGEYNPPLTDSLFEEGKKFNALWKRIKIKKGDKITVSAEVATDGNEWTRARWAGIIFAPVGSGKDIQDAPSSYSQN